MHGGQRPSWRETLVLALLLATHAILALMGSGPTNDDAFISLRYARNLVEGRGLVFNEGERVEGYTNFLWTLIVAASMLVGDPLLAAKALGVAADLGLLVLVWRACRHSGVGWGLSATALLALDPALLRWSTRGLETSLFALLSAATLILAAGGGVRLTALAALLATLARPEGVVVAAAVAFALALTPKRSAAVRFGLLYSGGLLPYLAWKLVYYGNVLPNTYYAKSGGGVFQLWRGLAYVTRGWGFPELALAAVAIIGILRRPCSPLLRFTLVGAVAMLAAVVHEGGDALGLDRFLAPIVPLLVIAAVTAASRFTEPLPPAIRALGPFVLLVACVPDLPTLAATLRQSRIYSAAYEEAEPGTRLGKCLRQVARPGDSVATSLIGRVPYYSRLYTLDEFGLIDPRIAHLPAVGAAAAGHEKTDPAYILSRKPSFILGGMAGEVIVGPPRERTWLSRLRRTISGEPPDARPHMLVPPYRGYELVRLPCISRPLWRLKASQRQGSGFPPSP